MEDDQYDEFGNYIGEEEYLSASEPEEEFTPVIPTVATAVQEPIPPTDPSSALIRAEDAVGSQVILHEEKSYYPSAEQVYGEEVETLVQEEDTQLLSEPIIRPISLSHTQLQEKDLPPTAYSKAFLVDLLKVPALVRNVAIIGHLHHGKTSLVDSLVRSTHLIPSTLAKHTSYTDTHLLERQRGLSIKATPISLLLQTEEEKSYAFNLIDAPGHVDFADEVAAATRLADGALLCVDAVEGLMLGTEHAIRRCLREHIPIVLVITKVERLILELRLPPTDAYFKLRHLIEEVNSAIAKISGNTSLGPRRLSPLLGNVIFSSPRSSWSFTLSSFASMYASIYPTIPTDSLARRLWGDLYYNPTSRSFSPSPKEKGALRSFVHFILQPLYKIYAHTVGEDPASLPALLGPLGVRLRKADLSAEAPDLLRTVLSQFFGPPSALVQACLDHIPSPVEAAAKFVQTNCLSSLDGAIVDGEASDDGTDITPASVIRAMSSADPEGPLVLHVAKLYPDSLMDLHTEPRPHFNAFARVLSGTLRSGQPLRVLGEAYSQADEEDMAERTVSGMWLHCARYRIPVETAGPGSLLLLAGVDDTILRTATLLSPAIPRAARPSLRPLDLTGLSPSLKVAVEPVNPTELPRLLGGLRAIARTYPMAAHRTEESGEHVLLGPGEMYLDCVLHDLRRLYARVEIRVADPTVRFSETVVEASSVPCWASSQNGRNRLTMLAEPLDKGIAEEIEDGALSPGAPSGGSLGSDLRAAGAYLREHHQWDILASRSLWAFGPAPRDGPNILCDDTLPSQTDKRALTGLRDPIIQGFQWGSREGPLCDEPMRSVKFRILDATISPEPIHRGSGQIIPAARRAVYSSFLTAKPRLMEPVNFVEVQAPADCVSAIYDVLARRRGHVLRDIGKAGSPLYSVHALIPLIDALGFETDLRTHTQGQAFAQQIFHHWQVVPGDPLDKAIILRPLEPSPAQHLARDFMLKTRRRKGLSEDVSVGKYFDEAMLLHLAAKGKSF